MGANMRRCPSLIGAVFEGDIDQIVSVGVDYQRTPQDVRDQLAQALKRIADQIEQATASDYEIAFLFTCARVEVFGLGDHPARIYQEAAAELGLSDSILNLLTVRKGEAAVAHLLKTASGLESELLGEYEIVSQLKAA